MVKDIMLDDNNELAIIAGDLVVSDSRYQHIRHLMEAEKGYYKFDPKSGMGLNNIINDELAVEEVLRIVRFEAEADGFKFTKLVMSNLGNIEIEGDYNG